MSTNSTDPEQRINQARRESGVALGQLLDSCRNYLLLLARTGIDASLQGKADPSDVVQETLAKAHLHFDQFRGQTVAELAVWLRQILARTLADLVRRYRTEARLTRRERSLDEVLDHSSQVLGNLLAAAGDSPSQSAERREMCLVLADALQDLPEKYREVLVLRSIEDLDWDEVAKRMGRSIGSVRMLWARALKQLRPLIEGRL